MKNKFKIRSAKLADLSDIKKLLSQCNLPVQGLDDQFGDVYCIAELNGKIIGVAGIEPYCCYGLLHSVAVAQSWQGKSIAKSLVKNRLNCAKSSGLTDVFLLTINAAKYFEPFGLCPIERDAIPTDIRGSSEFSSVCPKSAITMVKHLE